MTTQKDSSFAALFKKYRLRSEIETLAQFGDLLAQEGLIYEDSLFTRWQRGNRIPKERKTLLKIIKVFRSRNGIRSIEEANQLLMSVDMYVLTNEEMAGVGLSATPETSKEMSKVNDISLTAAALLMWNNLRTSKFAYWILGLFIIQTIWFIRIQALNLHDTTESYYFNWIYGFIALSGAVYGFVNSKKSHSYLLSLLSLGLLSEWFGVQLWFYYNLNGINVPFPSLADIGYAGVIPIYILAALNLLSPRLKANKKLFFMAIPFVIMILCYSIFLQTVGLSFIKQLKFLLDFIHPTGEIVPITIVAYLLLFRSSNTNMSEKILRFLLFIPFLLQFITDYAFMYTDQTRTYVNAGYVDYFYVLSYTIMTLSILTISKLPQIQRNQGMILKTSRTEYNKRASTFFSILKLLQLS